MTRSEKKCLAFSVGMHSLLAIIFIGSAAFESQPRQSNMPILSMIPAKIIDGMRVGGGRPDAAEPPPQPLSQPQQQPAAATPQPAPQPAPTEPVKRAVAPKQQQQQEQPQRESKPIERELPEQTLQAELPAPKPAHKTHEIQPDFTPYSATKHTKPKDPNISPAYAANADARAQVRAAARAEAKRQRELREALDALATGLESKPSDRPADNKGDGGESFADYGTVVRSIYFKAWTTPDNVANKLAEAKVKLVVAHDGTILSAEIVEPSGETSVDKSVERTLRAVTRLPEIPGNDAQRTFYILFNLEAKEGSG